MSKSLRKLSSSHLSATSFTSTSDEEFSSTYSTGSDSSYTTWTDGPTSTTEIGGWVEGTGRNSEPTNPSDSTSSSGGAGDLSHQEKQIVGGVVGSVAGVAFLLLLALMAIKYKKRRNDVQELIGDQGVGSRAITAGPASGGDGGSGAAAPMAERSGANPFGVPAALASLTGKNNAPPVAGTGERGFVRVSGKKLPSVLQHGGDGYSDPRGSVMSGESDYYRGSQAFEPGAGAHHLALGAPMRPVSGVPIMRSGPSRTAVTQENPFADDPFADPPSPPPPPPPRDPLGRSLGSQDGSRGSGSKFQENI